MARYDHETQTLHDDGCFKSPEDEGLVSSAGSLPPAPWSASNQYGMHFILSDDNKIILRADHLPMEVLKAMAEGANQHFQRTPSSHARATTNNRKHHERSK